MLNRGDRLNAILELLKNIFAFAGYLNDGKNGFPKKLSEEDEKKYILAWSNGDEAAREKLIEHNLRLAAHIAKKYSHGIDTDDFISIGTIGLIKGVNTFDTSKGKLSSYLSKCVENEILMYLRATKKQRAEVSLGESLGEDKDGNSISLLDILASESILTEDKVELTILSEKLLKIIGNVLTEREKTVIILRYGLYGNNSLPQREIAKKLNISRSYVSRIEKKALLKLRRAMEK